VEVKKHSMFLPPDRTTAKRSAFRAGIKTGTGSSQFYKLFPNVAEALGFLPKTKHGNLIDAANLTRNEARSLARSITKQSFAIDKLCSGKKDEAHFRDVVEGIYFLETSLERLSNALKHLKILEGLSQGNATIGCWGFISVKKDAEISEAEEHPRNRKKEFEKRVEITLLEEIVRSDLLSQKKEISYSAFALSEEDFGAWKKDNWYKVEARLNTAKAIGQMTGVTIQGGITSAIHFGLAVALANPALFAAGVYYATSTIVRVGGIAAKTVVENAHSRYQSEGLSSKVKGIKELEKTHTMIDAVAQKTVFNIAVAFVALPAAGVLSPGLVFYHATNAIPALQYNTPQF
jgi:hypothetical protein